MTDFWELQSSRLIEKVGKKLVAACDIPELQELEWEFVLIQSDVANAFVLPGNTFSSSSQTPKRLANSWFCWRWQGLCLLGHPSNRS